MLDFRLTLQGERFLVFNVSDGIVMRDDDHNDLVFAMKWFLRAKEAERRINAGKAAASSAKAKNRTTTGGLGAWYKDGGAIKAFEKRFPGTNVTSMITHRTFIVDLVVRAFWPTASLGVASNPRSKGGPYNKTTYNDIRLQLSSGKHHSLICT